MEYISHPNLSIYLLLSKFQPYISLTQNPIAINPKSETLSTKAPQKKLNNNIYKTWPLPCIP